MFSSGEIQQIAEMAHEYETQIAHREDEIKELTGVLKALETQTVMLLAAQWLLGQ